MKCTKFNTAAKYTVIAAGLMASIPSAAGALPMSIGGPAGQPIGQVHFCADYSGDREWGILCDYSYDGDLTLFHADSIAMLLVEDINRRINQTIHPLTDEEAYQQEETWIPATLFGDCEDVAMAKKLALHNEMGIPMHQMSLATASRPEGDHHAVLLLHTRHGVYVLDNLHDAVKPWNETDLSFRTREHRRGNQHWVQIKSWELKK